LSWFVVGIGAALGGMLRYGCSLAAAKAGAASFPWATLFVNVSGSLFIGFFATLSGPDGRLLIPANTRLFVMTGFCGGFTTFSTFSVETLRLLQDREWSYAALNIAGSLALCLLGVWLGHLAAAWLNQR
jgi:CrcB protein